MSFFTSLRNILISTTSVVLFCGIPIFSNAQTPGKGGGYSKLWKEADSLMKKQLPQSALKIVERIYSDAVKNQLQPEIVKAVIYRISISSSFGEEINEMAISTLEAELEKSRDRALTALLRSMLAENYWSYYRNNSWQINQRSVVADYSEKDIRLWDTRRLLSEVLSLYRSSLEEKELLQRIDLKSWDNIIVRADGSKIYRPTLYDFLAHRALEFFTSDQAGLTRPAEQFSLDNPGYLGSNNEFISLDIPAYDTLSLLYHTIDVYRELTKFHLNDTDPRALLEITIERLKFARRNGYGIAERDTLYLKQLEELSDRHKNHGFYPWIRYHVADFFYKHGADCRSGAADDPRRWNVKRAYEICRDAIALQPKGEGVGDCKLLVENIETKVLNLVVPMVNPPGEPMLFRTQYKNHREIFYRIIRIDPFEYQTMQRSRREEIGSWLSARKPMHEWSVMTRDPGDFCMHSFEYGTPALGSGYYLLMASSNKAFPVNDNQIFVAAFQVSSISYLSRTEKNGDLTLLVSDRINGSPMNNVRVVAMVREYDYQTRSWVERLYGQYLTNPDGVAVVNPPEQGNQSRSLLLQFITSGGDTLLSEDFLNIRSRPPAEERVVMETFLYLDRMIYRPGQTLYFKGIVTRQQGKVHSVVPNHSTYVSLLDVNSKEIGRLNMVTNEYGSFQGSFVLPSTGLTGYMTLASDNGSESFRMEEYKRPKFRVNIKPLEGVYKPGDLVTVQGSADAFAGFQITGANVKYRVTRQVRYPYRSYRFFPRQPEPEVEITHGESTIGDDGFFNINFTAVPDEKIAKANKPVFHYAVYVDVTDLNGETHSAAASVAVGYTMLIVSADIPPEVDKERPNVIPVRVTNLNNQPQVATVRWSLLRVAPPEQLYRQRLWDAPDSWVMDEKLFRSLFPYDQYHEELKEEGKQTPVANGTLDPARDSKLDLTSLMKRAESGNYLLVLETDDPTGEVVKNEYRFLLFSPNESRVPSPAFISVRALKTTAEPGETVTLLIGSSERVNVRYTLEFDGRVLEERWISLKNKQQQITFRVGEQHRGGLAVHIAGVAQNRDFLRTVQIAVPYTNKKLDIEFSTFRDKLKPGENEEYRVTIKGSRGEKVLAELLTGMYDASLDQFAVNRWSLSPYSYNRSRLNWTSHRFTSQHSRNFGNPPGGTRPKTRNQRFDQLNWFGFYPGYGYVFRDMLFAVEEDAEGFQDLRYAAPEKISITSYFASSNIINVVEDTLEGDASLSSPAKPTPDASTVQPRTVFNETAFFFPQLRTDENGNVVFSYTVPESLTEWKLMLLAHTPDLKSGSIEKRLVTQKELMVIPNAPRFFRERDRITFTAKVTNLSAIDQTCQVLLKLTGGLDGRELDAASGNLAPLKLITVKAGQSGLVSWELSIPERAGAITYRVTASSGTFSDGEEMTIPVLTNRMLVTESLPLWLTGKQTKSFRMEKLLNSYTSSTLKHHKLTLEYTSNPAWYAIQALPYLMEFPYECSEQLFSRLYANAIATHIANSQPRIKAVFDAWRNLTPDALLSNLEKNQELKALLLEETPWVRDAASESDRKQRVALLFDLNRMAGEMATTITKLSEQQTSNGGWPWFKGGPDSWYITQHIITGIGRMISLEVIRPGTWPELENMTSEGVSYLDKRFEEYYSNLKRSLREKPDDINKNNLSQLTIMYLYTRSWYLNTHPLPGSTKEAFEWLRKQGVKYWTSQEVMMQGYLSLALNRLGERATAQLIIKSLKERSLVSEEMGRYWRSTPGYYWYEAPIERQALLIEAFAEVAGDNVAVEEMKAWLLKQKQTNDWKTTKATAEACYALLLRGADLLASTEAAQISVGGMPVDPFKDGGTAPEAGTGYFKVSWDASEVTPAMGNVTVTGTNEGVSWGALYWQYFEDLDKITTHATPLELRKQLFVEENTAAGVVIKPITDGSTVKVGDRIVVRIELRVDRDMEYVHMKDMRASAFEPVTTLSGYKWQQGLGYYESPRDAAVNFFFDYLRKGTYLFEYKLFVTHAGDFSNGITTIQCMYAPEFTSHSEGIRVLIRE